MTRRIAPHSPAVGGAPDAPASVAPASAAPASAAPASERVGSKAGAQRAEPAAEFALGSAGRLGLAAPAADAAAKAAAPAQLQLHAQGAKAGEKHAAVVEQQYTTWANDYDRDTASYGWSAPARLLKAALEFAPARSHQRVLDVGVGTGAASEPFLGVGAQVTGLDISPKMLELAREKFPAFHHLGEHDIDDPLAKAGVKPGTYDTIVSSGVLHFAKDLRFTLKELVGALAPGGTLAFTFIPPQKRKFGERTQLHDVASVVRALRDMGMQLLAEQQFVAYHDKGKADDPVEYAMIVARKKGAKPDAPAEAAGLDRTACVDRARIATLMRAPLASGPAETRWTRADDPTLRAEVDAMRAAFTDRLSQGLDVSLADVPMPTRTADVARQGAPGCDALALFAHPDDEAVYAGGTLGSLSAAGRSLELVVATDGGGGRTAGAREQLAATRLAELSGSSAALGVRDFALLGFGDVGKYNDAHRADPMTAGDTLRKWGGEALVESIVHQVRERRPRVLVGFESSRDPNYSLHGHHLAMGVATAVAFHLAADPQAFMEQGLAPWAADAMYGVVAPEAKSDRRTVVDGGRETRRAALSAHQSQTFSLQRALEAEGGVEAWHLVQGRSGAGALERLLTPTESRPGAAES
jgi:LmbE family N-acetylglucosaminyl deacetylase/predicted TPR repeat methyltransferase